MKKTLLSTVLAAGMLMTGPAAQAADYVVDSEGMHAAIQFRIQHLGYSWLYGRFNDFEGQFTYDEAAPENAQITVNIDPASIDSNHAERDKHLRSADFLDVKQFPEAGFKSTAYQPNGDGTGVLRGDLTLHGVTKPVEIEVTEIGAGDDPWGGYRRGFEGTTNIRLGDFNIPETLGPASTTVELTLGIEGIRQ